MSDMDDLACALVGLALAQALTGDTEEAKRTALLAVGVDRSTRQYHAAKAAAQYAAAKAAAAQDATGADA